jgi:hypothetical protein
VLVFASLAVMLLYKGYDKIVEPRAAAVRAWRNGGSTAFPDMSYSSGDKVRMHCCLHLTTPASDAQHGLSCLGAAFRALSIPHHWCMAGSASRGAAAGCAGLVGLPAEACPASRKRRCR